MEDVGAGCQINTIMLVEVLLWVLLHRQSPFRKNLGEGRSNGKDEPSWRNSLVEAAALAAMKSCCVRQQVHVPTGTAASGISGWPLKNVV